MPSRTIAGAGAGLGADRRDVVLRHRGAELYRLRARPWTEVRREGRRRPSPRRPEVLELVRAGPTRTPAPGEVVIGVRAVTRRSHARRRGARPRRAVPREAPARSPAPTPPGVVLEVGAGVTRFAPGDRVVCTSTLFCGRCESCLRRNDERVHRAPRRRRARRRRRRRARRRAGGVGRADPRRRRLRAGRGDGRLLPGRLEPAALRRARRGRRHGARDGRRRRRSASPACSSPARSARA